MQTIQKPVVRKTFTFDGVEFALNHPDKRATEKSSREAFEYKANNYNTMYTRLTMEHGELMQQKDLPYATVEVFCMYDSDLVHCGAWGVANGFKYSRMTGKSVWLVKPQAQQEKDLKVLFEEFHKEQQANVKRFNELKVSERQLALVEYKDALQSHADALEQQQQQQLEAERLEAEFIKELQA